MQVPAPRAPSPTAADTIRALDRLREARPRVHCITNAAAQAFTANLLLAAGCTPSLTIAREEVGAFAGSADAVLINLGTLDAERRAAIPLAIAASRAAGKPFVLDPVFADRSPMRADFARDLIGAGPALVRANHAEAAALFGAGALERGDWPGPVLALTGPTDHVIAADRRTVVERGDPMMAKVTAMGCAGGAVVAGLVATLGDAFAAACAGLHMLAAAGEIAADRSNGPGTFAAAYLDAVHGLIHGDTDLRERLA